MRKHEKTPKSAQTPAVASRLRSRTVFAAQSRFPGGVGWPPVI
jgi:hypothetical protein